MIHWSEREDANAIFTALAGERMSDAGNADCPYPMGDAVALWIRQTEPEQWIPQLCDELKRYGYSISPDSAISHHQLKVINTDHE